MAAKPQLRMSVVIPPVNDSVATERVPIGGEANVTVGELPIVTTCPPPSVSVLPAVRSRTCRGRRAIRVFAGVPVGPADR